MDSEASRLAGFVFPLPSSDGRSAHPTPNTGEDSAMSWSPFFNMEYQAAGGSWEDTEATRSFQDTNPFIGLGSEVWDASLAEQSRHASTLSTGFPYIQAHPQGLASGGHQVQGGQVHPPTTPGVLFPLHPAAQSLASQPTIPEEASNADTLFDWDSWSRNNAPSTGPIATTTSAPGAHAQVPPAAVPAPSGSIPVPVSAPPYVAPTFQSTHRRTHGTSRLSIDMRNARMVGVVNGSSGGPAPVPSSSGGPSALPQAVNVEYYGTLEAPQHGVSVIDLMRLIPVLEEDLPAASSDSQATPMPTPATAATPSAFNQAPGLNTPAPSNEPSTSLPQSASGPSASSAPPLSISSFVPADVVRGDLLQARSFVIEIFKLSELAPGSRAGIIELYTVNLLVRWGKVVVGHLICSGSAVTPGDLNAHLLPFSDALEVSIAVSIAAQFSLSRFSIEDCRRLGWRQLFLTYAGQTQVTRFETNCINPALGQLQDFFMEWLLAVCRFTIHHVLRNRRIFPEFAALWGIAGELMRALLEYAAGGGYLHWYGFDSAVCLFFANLQNFELFLEHGPASRDLVILKGIINKTEESRPYFIRYFQHLSLAYISNFNVDWLSRHGALTAVQMFVQGRNPFLILETSTTPSPKSDLPAWISLTYVSSGVISTVLGALEQMGPANLSAEAIVEDPHMMGLYSIKVASTKRLIRDLLSNPLKANRVRKDLDWVSAFNYWKADMAARPTHLITNIPSLYIAWDPTSVVLADPQIRGVVPPSYTANEFMEEYHALRKAHNAGGAGIRELPFSDQLADLIEKSYRIANDRQVARIRQELERTFLLKVSVCTEDVLGDAAWPHLQQHLLHISQSAYSDRVEQGGKRVEDPFVAELEDQLANLEVKGKQAEDIAKGRTSRRSNAIAPSSTRQGKRKATKSMTSSTRARTAPKASSQGSTRGRSKAGPSNSAKTRVQPAPTQSPSHVGMLASGDRDGGPTAGGSSSDQQHRQQQQPSTANLALPGSSLLQRLHHPQQPKPAGPNVVAGPSSPQLRHPLTLEQQQMTAVGGVVPIPLNITATFNFDCRLDVETIPLHRRNVECNPKMVLTGAKPDDDSRLPSRKYARIVQKLGFDATLTGAFEPKTATAL